MSTTRACGLALAGLTAAALALSACSSTPAASNTNPPVETKTIIKGETLNTQTTKPTGTESAGAKTSITTGTASPGPKTSGGSGQPQGGFDSPAFQQAMASIGVPATSSTAGSKTTGGGKMSYTMTGNQVGIGRIECSVTAQGGSDSQSDHDALALSSPYLEDCGAFSQYGALKTQAAQYVTTNLPTLQGGSTVTTTVGAVQLNVGRVGPGSYSVTIVNGG